MEPELRSLLGGPLYERVAAHLGARRVRAAGLVDHPTVVPVALVSRPQR
jgi:hypothetical protein